MNLKELNLKICEKRKELHLSIEQGKDYSYIYKISVELDELIAEYIKYEAMQVIK